jgi:hypothetical protein
LEPALSPPATEGKLESLLHHPYRWWWSCNFLMNYTFTAIIIIITEIMTGITRVQRTVHGIIFPAIATPKRSDIRVTMVIEAVMIKVMAKNAGMISMIEIKGQSFLTFLKKISSEGDLKNPVAFFLISIPAKIVHRYKK